GQPDSQSAARHPKGRALLVYWTHAVLRTAGASAAGSLGIRTDVVCLAAAGNLFRGGSRGTFLADRARERADNRRGSSARRHAWFSRLRRALSDTGCSTAEIRAV